VALSVLGSSAFLHAQEAGSGQSAHPHAAGGLAADAEIWRNANQAVARFPRGHADVLQAEAQLALPPHRPTLPALPDAQAVLRAALVLRPDLWASPTDNPNTRQLKQQAVTTWSRDMLQAWWLAAATHQDALLAADQAESARLASELAHRMAQVGNWSEARKLEHQRTHLMAQDNARTAQQAALNAHLALQRMASTPGGLKPAPTPPAAAIDWAQLPAPLEASQLQGALLRMQQRPDWQLGHAAYLQSQRSLPPEDWAQTQQRMAQQLDTLPSSNGVWTTPPEMPRTAGGMPSRLEHAWHAAANFFSLEARLTDQIQQAWQRVQVTRAVLLAASQQALPLAKKLEEETQKRANGMLLSTWEVLAAQRSRVEAEREQVRAQRDWQLAWLDWQAVLNGADPALLTLSTGAATAAATPEGH
jgi:hypothetical protein